MLGVVQCKVVKVLHAVDHRVNGGGFKGLELSSRLLEDIVLAAVKRPEEEHDHQDGWDGHFGTREVIDKAVELGAIFPIQLVLPLDIIEERHEAAEGGGHRLWLTVLVKRSQHLEPMAIVEGPLVLKEEMQQAILDRQMELKLPDAAGWGIGGISHKCNVGTTCGEHVHVKVDLDDLVDCKIGLSILNGVQLEKLESINPKGLRRCRHWDHRNRSQTQGNRQ